MMFVVSNTTDNARAWMRKRGVHLATVVVDPAKLEGITDKDQVAYVGEYWLNPAFGEIQHRLPDRVMIVDIPDHERGDLTRIIGLTSAQHQPALLEQEKTR